MLIIGCDFHTRYQQIAMMDDATGELLERRLEHENGEAEAFYLRAGQPFCARPGHPHTHTIAFRVSPCDVKCQGL